MNKPFSQACENNKTPILSVLKSYLNNPGLVLEIGSGTGQHSVFFSRQLPHLTWQPTDRAENLEGIRLWQKEAQWDNLKAVLEFDINSPHWPVQAPDYVFTANTAHIMSCPRAYASI